MSIRKNTHPRFLSGTFFKSFSIRFLNVLYAALFALAFSFSFVSCSLEMDGQVPGKNSDGQINYDPQKKYKVNVNFNLFSDERLIVGPDFGSTDFINSVSGGKLKIYDGGSLIKEFTDSSPQGNVYILLTGGNHELSAEYLKDSKILFRSEPESCIIGDNAANINVKLKAYQDKSDSGAKGTVKVKLKLPKWESGFAQTYFIKCGIDNIEVESGAIILNAASETEKEFTINNVPAGSHPVNIVISPNSTYSPNILYSESVIVFSNLTSDTWFESTGATATTKIFTLDEMQPQDTSDIFIYVKGTGGTYSSMTQTQVATAVGAKLAVDFTNLKKAIDWSVQAFPSSTEYTINIDGEVTLDASDAVGSGNDKSLIEINSNRTFNFKGTSAVSKLKSPGGTGNRILKVNAGTVNISDLIISGGYLSDGAGGGIYIASGAKVELGSGADISDCSAKNGGGVYNKGTLVLSDGTIGSGISNNTVGSGGTGGVGSAVYNAGNFTIKGSSYLSSGNDVYLESDKVINIEGNLLTTKNPIAKINPSSYKRGLQLLSGDLGDNDDIVNKFKIIDNNWKVSEQTESGEQKGKLSTGYVIYVAGTVHSTEITATGDDANGDSGGTKSAPYATIEKAVKQCWNPDHEFTIKVSGKLTDAQTIPAANNTNKTGLASSIVIEGYTNNASDYIDRGLTAVPSTGSGSCLTVNTTTKVTIKNFKLTGGYAENGGGIYCNTAKAKITLDEGALVTANQANGCGGGVYVAGTGTGKATFDMKSAEVSDNTLYNSADSHTGDQGGGGIYIHYADCTIVDSTIKKNKAILLDGYRKGGGGIFADFSTVIMRGNSLIKGNKSINSSNVLLGIGGGVLLGNSVSLCMYENAKIGASGEPNEANKGGGVGVVGGSVCLGYSVAPTTSPSSSGTTTTLSEDYGIVYNKAKIQGGGIYCANASLYLDSGNVSYNEVTESDSTSYGGGGIYISNNCSALSITGSVISSNKAEYRGGGVFNDSSSAIFTMTGGVIENNTATTGSGIYTKRNIKLSGSTRVGPGTLTETQSETGNDIYLLRDMMISVPAALNKVFRITPSDYSETVKVIDVSTDFAREAVFNDIFLVTKKGSEGWHVIKTNGDDMGYLAKD